MKKYIIINSLDNVMVALEDFYQGETVNQIKILEDIKKGHKVALRPINQEEDVIKYGHAIGKAMTLIPQGAWVHTHNVRTKLGGKINYVYEPEFKSQPSIKDDIKVNVYLRKNGEVGIRNELYVIPTVGCVNGQANEIVKRFKEQHQNLKIDGVYAYQHPYGCSQMGDDYLNTRETLQNICKHPNAGGVLVLGLGCENNQIKTFKETMGSYDEERTIFINSQDVDDEIEVGVEALNKLYDIMQNDVRTPQLLSKIKIGLKCGGSDGLSGLTGNPLIGKAADYFIEHGGTAVLTEIPEMFGAEDTLLRRCESEEVFNKLVNCINDFKDYYQRNNQVIYENPSPGNKTGGITTLEDKSLGCVEKSGSSNVVDVLKHTERLKKPGLNILSGPGNDLIATTALGMCGCQLVLFSTGRGTPFGSFIPVIKISTNTELYNHKPNWIDFNSGELNNQNYDMIFNEFINFIIQIIEGKETKNEKNNFREIAILKMGVTL